MLVVVASSSRLYLVPQLPTSHVQKECWMLPDRRSVHVRLLMSFVESLRFGAQQPMLATDPSDLSTGAVVVVSGEVDIIRSFLFDLRKPD